MIEFVTIHHLLSSSRETFAFQVKNVALCTNTDTFFVNNPDFSQFTFDLFCHNKKSFEFFL